MPVGLWAALVAVAGFLATVVCWFAVLVTGQRPEGPTQLIARSLQLTTRSTAYLMLLTDVYPQLSLDKEDYPVQASLDRQGPGSRLSVLFRGVLFLPAALMQNILTTGLWMFVPVFWVWILITGRTPVAWHQASLAVLRWSVRTQAYSTLLTGRWPSGLAGDPAASPGGNYPAANYVGSGPFASPAFARADGIRGVLRLRTAARVLLAGFVLVGLVGTAASFYSDYQEFTGAHTQAPAASGAPNFGDPTSPPAAAATPAAAAQSELLDHIPQQLRSTCRPTSDSDSINSPNEITALSCPVERAGQQPIELTYRLYPDTTSAQATFQQLREKAGPALDGTNAHCDQGQTGAGTWLNTANQRAGALACATLPAYLGSPPSTFVFWTDDAHHLTAEIDSEQLDLGQLFAFWASQQLTV
jgi:hypothetical protein